MQIVLTGGTGSFGQEFLKRPLTYDIKVISRDELKQSEMKKRFPHVEFKIGDIRNPDFCRRELKRCDIVIHAAALKQVPAGEENPRSFYETNIIGTSNLLDWTPDGARFIMLSTDKAVNPSNLYGATKMVAERLVLNENRLRCSILRYGNVVGSRGSVIPLYLDFRARGLPLPITSLWMTRFWITLPQAVDFAIKHLGGEHSIYVPRLPSVKISTIAKAIGGPVKAVGIRPGEKLHEVLVGRDECAEFVEQSDGFYRPKMIDRLVKLSGSRYYSSDHNDHWITEEEVQQEINRLQEAQHGSA